MFKLKQVQNMIEGFSIALSNLSRGSLGSRASSGRSGREHGRLGSKGPSQDDLDPIVDPRGADGSGSHVEVQTGDIELDLAYKGSQGKVDGIQITKRVDLDSSRR
jgi:hypothetical protein